MENKKGNGIFLGIVSVATLIVAIIGATFAFFSASTQSEQNAVNLEAYEYKLSLSVSQVWEFASGLIPLKGTELVKDSNGQTLAAPNNTHLLYAINVGNAEGKKCVDDNGLQVCALYEVTIRNDAFNEVTLTGEIKTTANNPGNGENAGPFTNLVYQQVELLDPEKQDPEKGFSVIGQPIPLESEVEQSVQIADITIPGADQGTSEAGIAKTYILVYLNDNGSDQSSEMGAKYEGQLIYTGGTGNTLTGTFKVAGTTENPEGA